MYLIFDQVIFYNYLGLNNLLDHHIKLCDSFQFQNIFNICLKN
jgi:hypothetical protein